MDNFKALFEKQDLKLEEILGSPDLVTAIRSESSELFDFLSQDSVITELAEWCMTSKFIDHPKYQVFSVIAVSVFLATSMNIFDFVLESPAFAEILHHFLESDDSLNSKYCGHFYRILSTQIRWGTPALFVSYNDTQKLLFNRIQMSAIRDMIELIILTSADEALNTQQALSDLAIMSESNDEFSYDAETCLIDVFTSLTPDSDIFIHFCHPEYINHMINAAIKCPSQCMAHDILKMIISISKVSPESILLSEEQKNILTIRADNITSLSITSIPIVDVSPIDVFSLFFAENVHPQLHDKLCYMIEDMTSQEINEIAAIPDFIPNLINSYNTSNWCPHMLKIALIFSSIEVVGRALRSRSWCSFIRHQFLPVIKIIDNEYGGHIASGYEDSEGSDNEFLPHETRTQYWAEEEDEEEEFENLPQPQPLEENSSRVEENDHSDELEIYI